MMCSPVAAHGPFNNAMKDQSTINGVPMKVQTVRPTMQK